MNKYNWLALAIGNSRLHWAWFEAQSLKQTWDTQHLSLPVESDCLPREFLCQNLIKQQLTQLPIYIASVVTQQTQLWHNYNQLNFITLEDIQLQNLYPTLGVDRALAAWGAVTTYNCPCLVIDGGTALTFTGVDSSKKLIGGAILPGLKLQFNSLKRQTSALPQIQLPNILPPRWALNTDEAISSGVIYSLTAGIHSYILHWQQQFSASKIIFTGGDGKLLAKYFDLQFPEFNCHSIFNYDLIFQGIKLVYFNRLLS